MKNELSKIIESAIDKLGYQRVDFSIEFPADLSHGDYATNVAMILAKQNNEHTEDVAEKIVSTIKESISEKKEKSSSIAKIEYVPAGFINFYLSNEFFWESIQKTLEQENTYGRNEKFLGQKMVIEYTDPNPFKQFHIGHLMANTIGEAISRILEWSGANIYRICYGGDFGMHVAKAIWGMKQNHAAFPHDDDLIEDKTKFLGESYVYGSEKYESDQASKSEIEELNRKIYEFIMTGQTDDDDLRVYYEKGKEWSLNHFENIYKKLDTKFDQYIFESQVATKGEEIVRERVPEVFELSEGAVIYDGEKDGLHKRVFINSFGIPTYETKDVGLAFLKEEIGSNSGEFSKSVIVTASEQKEYMKVVYAAISKINKEISAKTTHITHGMMRFADGKMSSRKGNLILGDELLKDIENSVAQKISDQDLKDEEKEEIMSSVSVGAIKYSVLKQAPGRDIIFDGAKSVSFEGDSGPYLQYTYTRAKSVLEKAQKEVLTNVKELAESIKGLSYGNLERLLCRFPEIVDSAVDSEAKKFNPQTILNYLVKLAGEFNSFYANNKIIEESESAPLKIALTKATTIVLKNGLTILGIKSPAKM